MLKRKSIVIISAFVLIVILTGFFFRSWSSQRERNREERELRESSSKADESLGIVSSQVSKQFRQIRNNANALGELKDSDLDECLKVWRQGPMIHTNLNWESLAVMVVLPVTKVKQMTPSQYAKVNQLAKEIIEKGFEIDSKDCHRAALGMLKRCKSPQRAQFGQLLLNSKYPEVRKSAKEAISD